MAHILLSIKNVTGRYYRPIWEECDGKAAFELCNRIRKHTKVPEYSRQKFDEGFQYRTILTYRCFDCGQDFYREEPQERTTGEIIADGHVVDDEEALNAAQEAVKKTSRGRWGSEMLVKMVSF